MSLVSPQSKFAGDTILSSYVSSFLLVLEVAHMIYSTTQINPYIIGRPIDEKELFFGRRSLFEFVEEHLRQNDKIIFLHGQRRIGKSSVLRHIAEFVDLENFVFVPCDLEYYHQDSLGSILQALAQEIVDYLQLDTNQVKLPKSEDLARDTSLFLGKFLPQVYQALAGKKLVLLLDEFDYSSDEDSGFAIRQILTYLKSIISVHNQLYLILFGGRQTEDLSELLSLFEHVPTKEIGLLDYSSTQQLITEPAKGLMEYESEAIQAIYELSAGHPYFTQVICFALFGKARELGNWRVKRADVEAIVDKAIENAEGGLAWFWDGLSIAERVVFAAVAEAQHQSVPTTALKLLQNSGVMMTSALTQAAQQLKTKGFLDAQGQKVKVEFVCRWLVQRYPLHHEIWELEKLDIPKVNCLYNQATSLWHQGKKPAAIELYQQVLALNPNHFSALFALAEAHLESENCRQAVALYQRAYQVDAIRTKGGALKALLSYGKKLLNQGELAQAKEQYKRVLAIERDNASAFEKLLEIEQQEAPLPATATVTFAAQKRSWFSLGSLAAAVGVIVLVGLGVTSVSRGLSSCASGQSPLPDIFCNFSNSIYASGNDPNFKISTGDRTLFPFQPNANRDNGIVALQQQNYFQAAEFFSRAVKSDPSNPEALIYYNNAKARQAGSPYTIAAVVPVDNAADSAAEILRGVAQAQNQFNNSGGLNGRLLEVAIANDGNEPKQSRQIAQKLANNPAILGVIGHSTSDASKAALAVYEQAGLPMISPTSSSTLLKGDFFFRTVPSDAAAGKKLATYIRNSLGLDKVVIFTDPQSIYSRSLSGNFRHHWEQLGGRILDNVDLRDPNLDAEQEVVRSLFELQAQGALLFPSADLTAAALEVARANYELSISPDNPDGRRLRLIGGDALYNRATLNSGGKAVEGLVLAVPWFAQANQAQSFSQAATQQWRRPVNWLTATSFDATQALIKALSPDSSRSQVLERLHQVQLSSRATSGENLQFTDTGERKVEPLLVEVVNGKFTEIDSKNLLKR